MTNNNRGFSLVELAIVIVIMGLIAAATVAGRSLIESAKMKSVISEIETYKIAVDNFKVQYEGLPGDLKNATSFWTSGTANGNGNGKIGTGAVDDDTEVYYAWDQLALARLVAGVYSGAGSAAVIGTNVPESQYFEGTGFSITYIAAPYSYADALSRNFPANYIVLGKNHATDNYLSSAAVTPETAMLIDQKVDDGTPDYGKTISGTGNGTSGACTSGSDPDIIYDLTNSGVACTMLFSME